MVDSQFVGPLVVFRLRHIDQLAVDGLRHIGMSLVLVLHELHVGLEVVVGIVELMEVDIRRGTAQISPGIVGIGGYKEVEQVHVFLVARSARLEIEIDLRLLQVVGQSFLDIDIAVCQRLALGHDGRHIEVARHRPINHSAFATHRRLYDSEKLTLGAEHALTHLLSVELRVE